LLTITHDDISDSYNKRMKYNTWLMVLNVIFDRHIIIPSDLQFEFMY